MPWRQDPLLVGPLLGNHRWRVDSPVEGPVIPTVFPCHFVIISSVEYSQKSLVLLHQIMIMWRVYRRRNVFILLLNWIQYYCIFMTCGIFGLYMYTYKCVFMIHMYCVYVFPNDIFMQYPGTVQRNWVKTHGDRVTHICVSKIIIIGSDNGLVPDLNLCWNIVNWSLGNKLQWNFDQNSNIVIQENACVNILWKLAVILSPPQRVKSHDDFLYCIKD